MPRFKYVNYLLYLSILLNLLGTGLVKAANTSKTYSLVLASASGTNLKWTPSKNQMFSGRSFYIEKIKRISGVRERLNLGFFSNREQAMSMQKKARKIYPGAWIIKTPPNATKSIIYTAPVSIKKSKIKPLSDKTLKQGKATSLREKQLDKLMLRAKTDFKNKKYSSAIRYLKALVNTNSNKYSEEALELLGLTRQRKGQKTHALANYEQYLKLYPDSQGSDRVRQRLAGLLTAASGPRKKIKMETTLKESKINTHGSLSQFYRSNTAKIDNTQSIKTLSQLNTFIDITTQHRSSNFDHQYQFTSDHIYDFIKDDDNSEFRFIETYYELSYRKTGSSGRLGRQTLRIGGLLNRFDGISAGYQFTADMRFNIHAGHPVEIDNKSSINTDKTFYGLTYETGTFLNNWNMNLFYFDQKYNDFNDRSSIGTEVYYRDIKKSLFGMIDYNLLYDEINILQLNANILMDQGRTAHINAFMRKAPVLSSSNALIGRQETSLDALINTLNIEQIYQLAEDRTANSQTITAGGSQRLNLKYQLTADLTLSKTDATIASGGVAAIPGTGTDYFIGTQLVGNNLLIKRDTGVLGIRYSNTEPSKVISLIANSRFPINRDWRINPRLQFDIRNLIGSRSQNKVRAIIRTDYTYINKVRFDFEIGYDQTDEENSGESLTSNNLFFTLGYRWNF
ncbi:MAG: hypothetical protein OQK98_13345 [Gammaproteobacteria bacterium]|nr:hypothetical protein [Gammaproteobacteria bacterium]